MLSLKVHLCLFYSRLLSDTMQRIIFLHAKLSEIFFTVEDTVGCLPFVLRPSLTTDHCFTSASTFLPFFRNFSDRKRR